MLRVLFLVALLFIHHTYYRLHILFYYFRSENRLFNLGP